METPENQTTPGTGHPPTMADGSSSNTPSNNAPPVAAQDSVPSFGGLRGGRPRKDGLIPGSVEALEADRKKDRIRKQRARSRRRDDDPSPLPSAHSSDHPTSSASDRNPPIGNLSLGGSSMPWQPEMLKPLFDQLLPTVEKVTINQIAGRAEVAKLPSAVVREIERDAAWNDVTKKALEMSAPQLAAKYLNKSGVSSDNQPEVVFGTALASIVTSHTLLLRKLDKLIAATNPESSTHQAKSAPPKSQATAKRD